MLWQGVKMNTHFELILNTESKVVACNILDFEYQADTYLAGLTQTFETDEDFIQAKEEIKTLQELESRTKQAIDNVLNGNKEITDLIETAKEIAERFRQARLSREKLVKSKEAEVKQAIIDMAIGKTIDVRYKSCSENTISLALEMNIPKSSIAQRIQTASKNKRTLDGLQKAVNTEKTLILAEISQEIARLQSRLTLIPLSHKHLFSDEVKLIAGQDDIEQIIAERVEAEKQRELEIKAKAEQEAREKAEREAQLKTEIEAKANANAQAHAVTPEPQTNQTATQSENQCSEHHQPVFNFMLQIPFTGTVEQARAYFAPVKALNYQGVRLTKLN